MFEKDLMGNYWMTWVDGTLKDIRETHKTKEARSKYVSHLVITSADGPSHFIV